ncbi:MAG: hypothetical protein AAF708_05850 [Deinococcota bacterium]
MLQQSFHVKRQGFALITTLIMLIVLFTTLTAYTFVTSTEIKTSDAAVDNATGFYSAETGYNLRAEEVRAVFEDFRRPEGESPTGTIPCIDGQQGGGAFGCTTYELNDRTIHTYIVEDAGNGDEGRAVVIGSGVYQGLNAIQYGYDFFSDAYPPNEERPEARVETRLNVQLIPLFQFVAFYNKDLEIHPGPPMNLNGRIHVNGDLYMTAGSGLDVTGQVSTARRDENLWPDANNVGGTLNTFRKDKNDSRNKTSVFDTNNQRDLPKGETWTVDNDDELDPWNGRIQVGLDTLIVPPVDDFGIDDEATYWSRADLRILLRLKNNSNHKIEVHDNDGNINRTDRDTQATNRLNNCIAHDVYPPYVSRIDGNGNNYEYVLFEDLGNNNNAHRDRIPKGYTDDPTGYETRAVEWSQTFYDGREDGDDAQIFLEVDITGLLNCITQNTNRFGFDIDDESTGGLVFYFSVIGPDSDEVNNYGIRVRNGEEIAASVNNAPDVKGLTIVSDQAIFVQGDYNAEESDANNTTWVPASLLGDAINVLSERFDDDFDPDGDGRLGGWDATIYWWDFDDDDWDDMNYMHSKKDGIRDAVDTTLRAAVLGGTDITGREEGTGGLHKGNYNGGLENYPRFHEDWGGRDFTYAGSFVSLDVPQYKDGAWGGNYYSPPKRIWQYEEAFNNASNLPPLSPRATFLQQGSFARAYFER